MENTKTIKEITKFLLRPLIQFKKNYEQGGEIYKYLYFTRNGSEAKIDTQIQKNRNIVLVGNPGQGKTSMMHFLFEKYKELEYQDTVYPIILDYREINPKNKKGILKLFVEEIRNYFRYIDRPVNITEKTTINNCEEQLSEITRHLHDTPKSALKPKILIFLDDLDYAESEYYDILKGYFLNFASSDKCVIVLSVRKPLYNNLKQDDQLRQHYLIHPREVEIPYSDMHYILKNRLKTFVKEQKKDTIIDKFLSLFKAKSTDDKIIKLMEDEGLIDNENKEIEITLPFTENFYVELTDILYFNLRFIEELFPSILEYELKNNTPSLEIITTHLV